MRLKYSALGSFAAAHNGVIDVMCQVDVDVKVVEVEVDGLTMRRTRSIMSRTGRWVAVGKIGRGRFAIESKDAFIWFQTDEPFLKSGPICPAVIPVPAASA